jgi:hypothetical protein
MGIEERKEPNKTPTPSTGRRKPEGEYLQIVVDVLEWRYR